MADVIERMPSNSWHECISKNINAHTHQHINAICQLINQITVDYHLYFFALCLSPSNHFDWNTNKQQFFLSCIAMQSKFVHNKRWNLEHVISCKIAFLFPAIVRLTNITANNNYEQLCWKTLNGSLLCSQRYMINEKVQFDWRKKHKNAQWFQ